MVQEKLLPLLKNRNVKYLPTGKILTIETSQRGSGARGYLLQPDSLYLNKKIRDVEKIKLEVIKFLKI